MKQEGLKNEHELQSYFIRRIEKFINSPGTHPDRLERNPRRRPGPERGRDGLDWRGGRGRQRGARRYHVAHRVLLPGLLPVHQPRHRAKGHRRLPAAEQGVFLRAAPSEPGPAVPAHILGAQGNLWTEYIPNFKHAEYMAFPRLARWPRSPGRPGSRNWDDFTRRLQAQFQRFDQLGVNYRKGTPAHRRVTGAQNRAGRHGAGRIHSPHDDTDKHGRGCDDQLLPDRGLKPPSRPCSLTRRTTRSNPCSRRRPRGDGFDRPVADARSFRPLRRSCRRPAEVSGAPTSCCRRSINPRLNILKCGHDCLDSHLSLHRSKQTRPSPITRSSRSDH